MFVHAEMADWEIAVVRAALVDVMQRVTLRPDEQFSLCLHVERIEPGESIVDRSLVDQWNLFPHGDD